MKDFVLITSFTLLLISCSTYKPVLQGQTTIDTQYGAIQGSPDYDKKKTFYGKNWWWLYSLGAGGAGYAAGPQLVGSSSNSTGVPVADQEKQIRGAAIGLVSGYVSAMVFGFLRKEVHTEHKKYTAQSWLNDYNRRQKTNYIIVANSLTGSNVVLVPPQNYSSFITTYQERQKREAELATKRSAEQRQQRVENATVIIGGFIWLLSNANGAGSQHGAGTDRQVDCDVCGGSGKTSGMYGNVSNCYKCDGFGKIRVKEN